MANKSEEVDFNAYSEKINNLVSQENYGEAMLAALDGLNKTHPGKNEQGVKKFISLIKGIVIVLEAQHVGNSKDISSQSDAVRCSFCGCAASETEMLLGATGAICATCAEKVYFHFKSKPDGQ